MHRLNRIMQIGIKLIGPALLIYFLLTTDLEKLWDTLLQTNLWLYMLSLVLVFPFLVLKGWRWQLILNAWHIRIDLIDATALYCVGIFLGLMTPGQAGDAVKAWYLRQRGESLTAGLASVVLDRLFDVGIMGLLAATGLYFFWDVLPGGKTADVITVVIMLLAVAVGLIFAAYRPLRTWAIHHLIPKRLAERLNLAAMEHMHLGPGQLGTIALVSVAGLTLTFVRVYLLFMALATPIALGPFIALVAIIALVGTASPGGVGTRDAVLVVILTSILALSPVEAQTRALALSALLLSLNILNAIIGYVVSLRYPLDMIRSQPVGETVA